MKATALLAGLAALALAGSAQAQGAPAAPQPPAASAPAPRQTPQSLRDALAQSQAEAASLRQQLDQAQTALHALQAEGDQLKATLTANASTLEACKVKNVELIRLGGEILDRYRKVDLDDVLGAKEPFTGLKRVQLQNLSQGYEDRLYAGRYDPRRDKTPPAAKPAVTEPSSH